jgi:hypothetical protein
MSTKTLRKRIALVAVSAMGFGLLSVVPVNAAGSAAALADLNLLNTGSTSAVSAGANDTADTVYVRSSASAQTFVVQAATALQDASDFDLYLSTTSTVGDIAAATTVAFTAGAVVTAGDAGTAVTIGQGFVASDNKEAAVTLPDGTTAVDKVSVTTGALAAGTYYLVADPSPGSAVTTGGFVIATITSYDVGAPVSLSYNVDGRTQVGTAADSSVTSKVYDSTGRQTFLVGAETISHSWSYPVTSPASAAPDAVTAVNSGSTPAYTSAGATFAGYSTTLDLTPTTALTLGTVYTLTGVILNGVNAFGNDSMTYVNVATTNGLAGSLTLTSASTGAAITSIALANGQATTAANYVLTAKDSAGRVIKGVTPVLTASAGTVTTAVGTTVDAGTDSTFVYTAPATGTSATLTFTMFGGSAGNTTLSIPVSIGATYGTAAYGANMEVTANGGRLETSDTSDIDLSDSSAYGVTLDPSNTTSINVSFNLQNVVGGAFDSAVSGANLTVALGGTLPTAQRTLAASAVTTDAAGTATATIAVNTARTTETLTVTFSSGTASLGVATITFTAATTTIAEIVAGPANAITQQAGTATAVTVTATDQYGQAAANKRVQLTIVGPSAPSGGTTVVVTNASGVASYTVTGTTSVTGQTDTITVTQFEGSGVTAGANDIIAISYVATAPVVVSFGIAGALTQNNTASAATYTSYTTATLATAIEVANNNATAKAGAKFEDKAILPIDSLGNYTDIATKSGADAAAQDEVVGLRFRALNASSVALAGIPLVVTASTGAWVVGSLGQAVSTRTLYTDASGYIYVNAFATATGVATWTVSQGAVSASISVTYANDVEDARFVSVTPATASVTSGTLAQFVATVTDRYGNVVPGATVTWSELGAGRLEANSGATSATGTSTADFSTYATETGAGVVKAVIAYQGEDLANYVGATTSSYTDGTLIAAAAAGVSDSSAAITVAAPTTKSAAEIAIDVLTAKLAAEKVLADEAAAAAAIKAAVDKKSSDDAIAAVKAQLDAAAAKAAVDKAASDAAIAAAQAAAVEAAQAATDAATEALDAANAATDAANASAEAGDAATAAAQDAADAVAALSTQVSEMISALKKQITALTNLVIKIQKKVKA